MVRFTSAHTTATSMTATRGSDEKVHLAHLASPHAGRRAPAAVVQSGNPNRIVSTECLLEMRLCMQLILLSCASLKMPPLLQARHARP